MNNTSEIEYCYGCGVCAIACPKEIISIEINDSGFYIPVIREPGKCVGCGICMKVCAFLQKESAQNNKIVGSWAAWSKDMEIRHKCSSGGIGFELGLYVLNQAGRVCGVRYNPEKERAEHYIASSEEELKQTIGSKYIQSYTLEGFKNIDITKKHLVIGAPCQIDSFRHYIQMRHKQDNFLLMDFFCHGVPSMHMWRMYCKMAREKVGKIIGASWRNKHTGWHDSWAMVIDGEKGIWQCRLSQGDIFYKLFLGHYCMNKACQKECKYKYDKSSADIRIGDLWGQAYKKNVDGVSALIAFTQKGKEDIEKLKDRCVLTELPFDLVAEGQMKTNCGRAHLSSYIFKILKEGKVFSKNTWWFLFKFEAVLRRIVSIIKS